MTLSEIARRIEEIRPGTLPSSIADTLGWIAFEDPNVFDRDVPLPEDIARHMLIGAMVMATGARYRVVVGDFISTGFWELDEKSYYDSAHGNDPLRSLLAAFERVYAKEDKC